MKRYEREDDQVQARSYSLVQGILDQSKSSTSGSSKRIVETKLKTNCLWRNTSGLHSMYNVMWFGKKKQGMDGYHDDCSLFAGM